MNEWRRTSWGKVCSLAYGKAIRGYQNAVGPFVVYGTNGPIGRWHEPLQTEAGVVVGRKGAYRGIHYAPEPFFVIDTAYALRPGPDLDARWAAYCLRVQDINGMDSGSAIPSTNRNEFYALSLDLPPLFEQQAIAAVLGALDDKIELNRQMGRTLEEMARALFKSWFVDFDPVRAKAAGLAPAHMDPGTAALFPDSVGEDGLPEGWRMGTLGEVARNPREGIDPSSVQSDTPYIGLEHMPRRSIAISEWGVASDVSSTKSQMRVGQFLFGKLRPYFHKVGLVPTDGVCSTDILVVEAMDPIWREFVLGVISSDDLVAHASNVSNGARMPRAKWQDLAEYSVALSPIEVVEAYSVQVREMHQRILHMIRENQTLASLRDTLLPKLMSGELRVRDAERQIAEVA